MTGGEEINESKLDLNRSGSLQRTVKLSEMMLVEERAAIMSDW